MIGKVTGRLDYKAADHVLIDTGGVGYLVYCSERTLAVMPAAGGMVALYTEMVVREDLMQLFGFPTLAEREWHRLLTTVQGVGAKAALSILGTLGADGAGRAIALGDARAVQAAPGIGPKIAQRVILELKGKAPMVMAMGAKGHAPLIVPEGTMPFAETVALIEDDQVGSSAGASADALSALVNLGYAPGEAAGAVAQAGEGSVGEIVRAALKLLGGRG